MVTKNNKVIEKANEELEYLTGDAAVKRKAELREKWIMDYKNGMDCAKMAGIEEGLRQGREEGMKQGLEEGRKQGIERGIEQNKIEIIKEMLKLGVNKEIICKITKIEKEELERIEKYNEQTKISKYLK